MCFIVPKIDTSLGTMTITAKGMGDLVISLDGSTYKSNELVPCTLWGIARTGCRSQGDEAAKWFQTFLGISDAVLVRSEIPTDPTDDPSNAPMVPPGAKTKLQDFAPLLLVSEESVIWIHSEVSKNSTNNVTAENFRPNIVVRNGRGRFYEDRWVKININGIEMRLTKPCTRCAMPSVNIQTGQRDAKYEPTATLKNMRAAIPPHEKFNAKAKAQPMFGVNGFHMSPGIILLECPVQIVELCEHNPLIELGVKIG
jgi:uncharacterized protein YcbX